MEWDTIRAKILGRIVFWSFLFHWQNFVLVKRSLLSLYVVKRFLESSISVCSSFSSSSQPYTLLLGPNTLKHAHMHTIKRAQTLTATWHPKNTNQTHWPKLTTLKHTHTRAPRVCSHAVSLRLCRGQLFDILPCADFPPDPINHLCSLTGKYISENYCTYRSVQIFKILFPGLYPESDPPHKMMRYWFYYSTQLVFHFYLIRWSCWNTLYHSCTSSDGASQGGKPFNILHDS